jgi:hypothetical protein
MQDSNYACCSTWTGKFVCDIREEHRLRVFEIRMLSRIYGPKRDEVTVSCGSGIKTSFITSTLSQE